MDRNEFGFMKKIDSLIEKIDILSDINYWINFVKNECLECYVKTTKEEHNIIIKEAEFLDEFSLYFLYKVLLELHELHGSTTIRIKVNSGHKQLLAWKRKLYFQQLLNSLKSINSTKTEQIANLDKLGKEINYDDIIEMHGNIKSLSAYLLGIKEYKSFRINTKSTLSYKIKKIKKDQVKEIPCPVCGDTKILYWNNKDNIFKSNGTKVKFNCDHIESDYYDKFPVFIDLKDYKKQLKGIDEVDWVIYNYPELFKLFMNSFNKEVGLDNVI